MEIVARAAAGSGPYALEDGLRLALLRNLHCRSITPLARAARSGELAVRERGLPLITDKRKLLS